jgi:hypothetical protein
VTKPGEAFLTLALLRMEGGGCYHYLPNGNFLPADPLLEHVVHT